MKVKGGLVLSFGALEVQSQEGRGLCNPQSAKSAACSSTDPMTMTMTMSPSFKLKMLKGASCTLCSRYVYPQMPAYVLYEMDNERMSCTNLLGRVAICKCVNV